MRGVDSSSTEENFAGKYWCSVSQLFLSSDRAKAGSFGESCFGMPVERLTAKVTNRHVNFLKSME